MISFLYVAIGGALGAMLRYLIAKKTEKSFIGTWFVNITGSLLLAICYRLYMTGILTEAMWLFAGTGFCGAFTTFSTFGSEMIQLLITHHYVKAAIYGMSSFTVSLLFVLIALHI